MTRCIALLGLLCLSACTGRSVEVPIPTRFHECPAGDPHELAVLLPGLGDDMAAFERADFIELLCRSARPMSAVSVDAHIGYYRNEILSERVLNDILLPYHAKGYSRIILAGVSLGGLGAMRLAHDFPSRIAGVVLLAPYLGEDELIAELERAGSAANWRSRLAYTPQREEQVWLWIDDLTDPASNEVPNAIIGYGSADKFRRANEFLGKSLPASRIFVAEGDHDWQTWASLWSEILRSEAWASLGVADEGQQEKGTVP